MGAYFTVESSSVPFRLTFGTLQTRLIRILRSKLDNGEFTERGLARLAGISQPQVHNLLKGARRLSPESADLLLAAVRLSIQDLLVPADIAGLKEPPEPPKIPLAVLRAPGDQLPLFPQPEVVRA